MRILPKIIAHRGASALTPENTLASLRKAAELGASWVEFDVMLTADALPIVIHDETLSRTTNGEGLVADMPYAEIATLDAGSWFSPEFAGERVPLLSHFLEVAHHLGLGLNLEIKAAPGRAQEAAKVILEVLQRHWPAGGHNLLISSSCIESLRAMRTLAKYPLALLLDEWTPGWQQTLTSLHCISLNIHHSMATLERVKEAKQLVKYVLAYTVNDADTAQHCYDLGVDAVFSDNLLSS